MSDKISGAAGTAGLVAFTILYTGPEVYAKAFEGAGFGVVFDDDDETGYLYATTEDFEEVLDGLHLYNADSPDRVKLNEKVYIVWNSLLGKAGLYFHGAFQAVVDFRNAACCCRTGFPPAEPSGWCRSSHRWDDRMTAGLTFVGIEDE